MAIVVQRPQPTFAERTYIIPLVKGLGVTIRHMFRTLGKPEEHQTISFPEQRRWVGPKYRAKHRLTRREDGSVRCVACMMCATACPAECIHIVAGEHPDPTIEKYPTQFDIDLLKCVFCGMCAEACPVDAIRMDSGQYTIIGLRREDFVIHKEQLLAIEPASESPGPAGEETGKILSPELVSTRHLATRPDPSRPISDRGQLLDGRPPEPGGAGGSPPNVEPRRP